MQLPRSEMQPFAMIFNLIAVTGCVSLFVTPAQAQEIQQKVVVVDKAVVEYVVDVQGSMDPENIEITIENTGDTPVVNPRMTVNELFDWYNSKSLAEEITRGCRTDEEKAIAIWWWVRYRTYQRSPQDHSALHPVRAMNGYGYGICGHVAAWSMRDVRDILT